MLGPLEDVLKTQQDEGARDLLQLAHRNTLRLHRLVNTLLDFSRIEAGRMTARYELTDLSLFTVDLAALFRSAAAKAGLEMIVDCPPLRGQTYVDREMWEKVVLNLLLNALKYTLTGSITVSLRSVDGTTIFSPSLALYNATDPSRTLFLLFYWYCYIILDHAEFSVQDTGTGIPEEDLPKLFNRFHRVAQSKGRIHEGSGIGLALVNELVKLHHGSVHVTSEWGEGSTFSVTIPFGNSHLPAESCGISESEVGAHISLTKPFTSSVAWWLAGADVEPEQLGASTSPRSAARESRISPPSSPPHLLELPSSSDAGARSRSPSMEMVLTQVTDYE